MKSPHAKIQTVADDLRARFEALLSSPADLQETSQEESLTPGQMLLMGFNGLFEKLQMESNNLVSALASIDMPAKWEKVDCIYNAKKIAPPEFNEAARKVNNL